MEVRFDASTGHANQKRRHQHLRDGDDVTRHGRARPGSRHPNGKETDRAAEKNCRPNVIVDCFCLSAPGIGRDHNRHHDAGNPLAKHQFGKELVGLDVDFVLLLLEQLLGALRRRFVLRQLAHHFKHLEPSGAGVFNEQPKTNVSLRALA